MYQVCIRQGGDVVSLHLNKGMYISAKKKMVRPTIHTNLQYPNEAEKQPPQRPSSSEAYVGHECQKSAMSNCINVLIQLSDHFGNTDAKLLNTKIHRWKSNGYKTNINNVNELKPRRRDLYTAIN